MVWLLEAFPAAREDQVPLQVMLRSFLDAQTRACRSAEEVGFLGCTETAKGGESVLLLLGQSGGLRWAAGCLVKVTGGLNWAVEEVY